MLCSRKVWDLLLTAEQHRLPKNLVSRTGPRCFMLAAERGFPEMQGLWSTALKPHILMRLSEVLTKRPQRIAETKATACSAIEISRFKKPCFYCCELSISCYGGTLASFLTEQSTLCPFKAQCRTWHLFDVVFFVVP